MLFFVSNCLKQFPLYCFYCCCIFSALHVCLEKFFTSYVFQLLALSSSSIYSGNSSSSGSGVVLIIAILAEIVVEVVSSFFSNKSSSNCSRNSTRSSSRSSNVH